LVNLTIPSQDLGKLETIDATRENPFELHPQVIIFLLKRPYLLLVLFGSRSTPRRCAALAGRPPPPNCRRMIDPEPIIRF
jgi:hypothetical protein